MPLTSDDSFLEHLLAPEVNGSENVDFVLQKRRIEEIFGELLSDLETLGRVEVYLNGLPCHGEQQWAKLRESIEDRTKYDAFQSLLREFDEHAVGRRVADDATSLFLREVTQKVRSAAAKSLLRPPSPPVIIKNRAEQESFRWARLIARQESEAESLKRKIADYEQKIVQRQTQRADLQLRSKREKDEQLAASRTLLVEMKLEGDQAIQRLQKEIASQPHFETTPEYLASVEQHGQTRKRIAKLHVQQQLWIKKYDKFIGEPMPMLLELEERMAGFKEWREAVFKPQEERLQLLREQIRTLEAIAMEEKIEEIRKLHAVRVLQRAWKRTLGMKRSKKPKKTKPPKKGKGKKAK